MLGKVINVIGKFVLANAVVLLVIMLLPVFLITNNVDFLENIINYLFSNKS